MAPTLISRSYIGRAEEPASWETILQVFDSLFGEDVRSLPEYPEAIGWVTAHWQDGHGNIYKADSFEDVQQAYGTLTRLDISSNRDDRPDVEFSYIPATVTAAVTITASNEQAVEASLEVVRHEFPLISRFIFISYATEDFELAKFVASLLEARLDPAVSVFVAKRNIAAGTNPLKTMLEEQLPRARALLAVFTHEAIRSSWVWWESASVKARGQLVIPLFAGVTPAQVDGPITLVCQGRALFDKGELHSALTTVAAELSPGRPCPPLSTSEATALNSLSEKYRQR